MQCNTLLHLRNRDCTEHLSRICHTKSKQVKTSTSSKDNRKYWGIYSLIRSTWWSPVYELASTEHKEDRRSARSNKTWLIQLKLLKSKYLPKAAYSSEDFYKILKEKKPPKTIAQKEIHIAIQSVSAFHHLGSTWIWNLYSCSRKQLSLRTHSKYFINMNNKSCPEFKADVLLLSNTLTRKMAMPQPSILKENK